MQSVKFHSLVRRITTLTPKCVPATATASSLQLDSYCERSPSQVVYLNNRKIDGLIKSGDLIAAHELFDQTQMRDVVTYNLLISGHGRLGCPKVALYVYAGMVSHGVRESASTFSSVLSTCSDAGLHKEGAQVHCRVISLGFGLNIFIGSSISDLYMRMGLADVALQVSGELPERNLAAWNLWLRWFCELGRSNALLKGFRKMERDEIKPNGLSYSYLIRGCVNDRLLHEGMQLHCRVIKSGWVESNIFVANALVDLYSGCGFLTDALKSFECISEEDALSWNSIVSVYLDCDLSLDALGLFRRMQLWRKRPLIRTYVAFLNMCSRSGNALLGKQVHSDIIKAGFDIENCYVQSALIDMYGKCDDIDSSMSVYDSIADRSLECSNSMMTSLLHNGLAEDVIEMFGMLVNDRIGFDEVTLSTTLKALSICDIPSLSNCEMLHGCAVKSGNGSDYAVSCSLIGLYSRCGKIALSQKVFEEIASPNLFCFTSIINGYARSGMGRESINMLELMTRKGLVPDAVTILCVLMGCNHSGLAEEAKLVFSSMTSVYGIVPERKHYSCMVDLLGRAGCLEEAESFLKQAPGKPDLVMWSSLLQNARVHRNEKIGRKAAKMLMELEPEDFAVYLQVSRFYSEIGDSETSTQVKEIAMARKLMREIGYSWVEVKN